MVIALENVSLIRNKKYILDNINWNVDEGEHWCILGRNGAGKTALLNLLNGYLFPSKGTVSVIGFTFGKADFREVRKKIGLVSSLLQEKIYGHDLVEEVILSGKFASIGLYETPDEHDLEEMRSLMTLFGVEKLSGRTYDSLSQGEKQKVLILRALMPQPKLLILDEPCNGLDLLAREELLGLIETIAKRPNAPTILYVTHHVEEILPCFTNSLLLKEGKVFAEGRTEELLSSERLSDFFEAGIEVENFHGRYYAKLLQNNHNRLL